MAHPEGFGVTADDVKARLRADFSEGELEAAEAVLVRCGPIPESLRVQFAVLELAKGDLAMLRHQTGSLWLLQRRWVTGTYFSDRRNTVINWWTPDLSPDTSSFTLSTVSMATLCPFTGWVTRLFEGSHTAQGSE